MTQTTTLPAAQDADPVTATHPSDVLATLAVAWLTPMFLAAACGDATLARSAAIETLRAYTVRTQADLIIIAQIIAYGLATLGALSLALTDGLSISMGIRLRSSANACTRSAEINRRALETLLLGDPAAAPARIAPVLPLTPQEIEMLANVAETQKRAAEAQERALSVRPAPVPPPAPTKPTPAPTAQVAPAAPVAKPTQVRPVSNVEDMQRQAIWAAAMADVAAEFTAEFANLPPAERTEASRRAALLTSCATDLLSGNVPSAGGTAPLNALMRAGTI